jgi:ribosomal protein S18 acetylase RimI-like enzyme
MASDPLLPPGVTLQPMSRERAAYLGPAIAAIEPWSRANYPAAALTAFMTADDPALSRHAVYAGSEIAGVIAIRQPWLRGPYLQLLALLPSFQGRGLGAALLEWFAAQAAPHDRWLWLCYSSFNTRAGAFYARHGFEEAALLPDLVADGVSEVLMRKRLDPRA